jgi:hypothetical protein
MVKSIAKSLQILGLIILPAAMIMQLTSGIRAPTGNGITVSAMLLLLVFGCGLFAFGKLLEGTVRE